MKTFRVSASFALALLAASFATALAQGPQRNSTTSDLEDEIDELVIDARQDYNLEGISITATRGTKMVFNRAYGDADLDASRELTPGTSMLTGSISQAMLGAAVMRLVQQRELRLDTNVENYLDIPVRNPSFPDTPITLRMLVTHTSSIVDNPDVEIEPYATYDEDPEVSLAELAEGYLVPGGDYYFEDNFANTKPGQTYAFSRSGAALVGYIVEEVTGESLDDFCQREIWGPLNLSETGYLLSSVTDRKLALPYIWDEDSEESVTAGQVMVPEYPATTLHSNSQDLARFLVMIGSRGAYRGTRILSTSSVRTMLSEPVAGLDTGSESKQGVFWYTRGTGKKLMWGHEGSLEDGISSAMFYKPATKTGVVILMNSNGTYDTSDGGQATDLFLDKAFRVAEKMPGPDIQITWPKRWIFIAGDDTINIRWKTKGYTGDRVRIELRRDSQLQEVLTEETSNDGHFKWEIPRDQRVDDDYRIRISSVENRDVWDYSQGKFAILRWRWDDWWINIR